MVTLVTLTKQTRIALKMIAIGAAVFGVLFFSYGGFVLVKNIVAPPPPPPPENKFGVVIPNLSFPEQNLENITYRVNTVSGKLPAGPDRMKVYKMKVVTPNIEALAEARSLAKRARFDLSERRVSDTVISWSNSEGDQILYDIYSKSFNIQSSYLQKDNDYMVILKRKDQITQFIMQYLSQIGVDISDINFANPKFTFYRIQDNKLVVLPSQYQSQVAKISLFQGKVNDLPVNYPLLDDAFINFYIVSTNGSDLKVVEANVIHNTIDPEQSSTYLIKSVDQAFADLEKGKAFLVRDTQSRKNLDITNVFIGYFIWQTQQSYLVPVVVFEGPGFRAFVHALPDSTLNITN